MNEEKITKICEQCGKEKNLSEFREIPKKNGKVYYHNVCNEDKKLARKKYNEENKEKVSVKRKENYQKNIERERKRGRKSYYKNKEKILTKKKEYIYSIKGTEEYVLYREKQNKSRRGKKSEKKSLKTKLRYSISWSINRELKKKGTSKNGKSCLNYLPYSMQELKIYLESKFESWMNWENWGKYNFDEWDDNNLATWKWQLDHIIPHSEFNYNSMEDEDFKKCWDLSNLRPYSAKQNIIDGASRIRHKKGK